jgi:hypothetical protein
MLIAIATATTEKPVNMTIREQLLGSWALSDYVETPSDGSPAVRPLGEHPTGAILYNVDGYMSAQLSQPAVDRQAITPIGYYVAYSGAFEVDEDAGIVRHHLDISVIPALAGSQLARRVTFPDQRTLVLTALEPSALSGTRGLASITWVRHPPR